MSRDGVDTPGLHLNLWNILKLLPEMAEGFHTPSSSLGFVLLTVGGGHDCTNPPEAALKQDRGAHLRSNHTAFNVTV